MSKKILLANASFYPSVGGVENSLRSLSEEFNKQGMSVTIIASNERKLPEYERLFGADVYRYKYVPLFGYFITIALLMKKLKVLNFDLVVSRHIATTFVLLLLKVKKVKYIVPGVYKYQNIGLRNTFSGRIKYFINCKLEKYVLQNTDEVCVFSNTMESQVGELRDKEIVRLYPGVNAQRFFPVDASEKNRLRTQEELPSNKKVIFSIGRFVDVKNLKLAIDSLKQLDDSVILVLVGDGPLNNQLRNYASEVGIAERVFFRGATKVPEKYFKLADVFLLTSTYEPFGQVLLEASASKLPVVAINSDIYGIQTATKEIYNNFESLVHLSETKEAIAYSTKINEALSAKIDDKQHISFLEQYSWANMSKKLLS
ncbi:glycosyltransferase family 4 protein [Pseudoalteromonas sp. NSLLW218]|jgi:glycosyltransferase involved in cell wall biosynthesis|uniref:glycosyltransferase family 4 protein n=1 Tax=Pseudoalteromonas sp. NSLLW218 TaxID=2792048 RepID=UPI0018CDC689|nr:glycosyltransferase family 4 protein [Pseudoalteromonas sp. NSLLW218]MBH0087489.1 glycosyltransferase family 4 protein [Pseudoalteromonas sp. NSLLW218]